jgi:hypothetical protein
MAVEEAIAPRVAHHGQTDQVCVPLSSFQGTRALCPALIRVSFYSSLLLTTADIVLLYDDFALG